MNNNKYLETSLVNLRNSMSSWSLDEFLVSTIESLMVIERNEYLTRVKGADKGNGFYTRAFKSLSKNCLAINIPRSRSGVFTPDMMELVKIGQEQINEMCLALYRKGMTSRDISDLVEELFGDSVSATKVTNLSRVFNEYRIAWQNSKLEKHYRVVFCDCIFITVRRDDSYSREAVYVAYGVKTDNTRELLTLAINPTEGASIWGELFDELKNKRGVEKINLIVADGLTGLEDEVHRVFPSADFQKCVVHKMRSIFKKIRPKDKTKIAADLKNLFDNFSENDTVENANNKLKLFLDKWKNKYPNIHRFFKDGKTDYYFTYIKYHHIVRRMIYTTNSIENVNKEIRKGTKNKLSFESPDTLLNYVFMIIKKHEEKIWIKYPIHNYKYFKKLD